MRASPSNALLASLGLHAFVVLAILAATWFAAKQAAREVPVIFELVAGTPSGAPELVAPALGNTTKAIKLEVPKVELVPTMEEPEPVVRTQAEEAAVKPPPEKTKPKTPDKPKPDTSLAKEMKQAQRMSYKDYLKKHPTPKPQPASSSTRRVANVPRVDVPGIAGGVKGGSTSNTRGGEGGKALSREQQDQLSTYISMLIQELKRAHEAPAGVSDRLEAKVTFDITASGAILNPRITKSSGDKEFDQSVIDAFLRMRSIGPTPNRRGDTWTVTFKMRDEG
jgi:colicin import membrane protein